ncbi:MAG: inositol monophosphatase family protein [Myxococcota bacterium]|nr:inositol monophosphatase family protein [Myxococcota bacterium]
MTRGIQGYFELATQAAREAGTLIRAGWSMRPQIEVKQDDSLVTELDLAAEARIREILGSELNILGEEKGASAGEGEALWWYVDPVDGTSNLAHRFPWISISIALLEAGKPQLAVVYNPMSEHFFSAQRGKGAFLNGLPIAVSGCERLEQALLATGFPVGPHRDGVLPNLENFARMATRCHSIRRAGSAALDLAAVAAGWFDGFWELGLHPWDSAAGWLLVEEAGGRVSLVDGTDYDPHVPQIVASNGRLHAQMMSLLSV